MIGIGLIVVIVIVVSIILATRSKEPFHSGSGTEGVSVTRRVWLYVITLISLGIFAGGLGQLLTLLFDITIKGSYLTQIGMASFNQQQLSLGLAMTVIGGPLWFLFWRAVQRRVRSNQEETGTAIRKFYLNIILLETALMGITTARNFLNWLIAGVRLPEFSSNVPAIVIVAGVIWYYHWRVSENEGHSSSAAKTLRRWYVYILSGFGLVWLAMGLVQLINNTIINLPIWGDVLVRGQLWNNTTQTSIAQIILGSATWYFHWFRMARCDFDSTLRQVYFYLLTISGGAIAALVASTILFFRLFIWIFGAALVPAGTHFQFLGWAVPTILVGTAIWGYHQRAAEEEAGRVQEKRQSAQRVYFYLMSFLGIGTLVTGLSVFFGMLVDLIISTSGTSLIQTAGWWRNQIALWLALLLVGTPIWLYYWNGILKRAQAGVDEEWRALSRRIFLYVIIGASIIALAADLVNILYQLLNGLLQGNFGVNVLRSTKWSLQTLIVAIPLLWYHWQILRTDQRRGAESAVIRHSVTLLANDRSGELAFRLENKLGYKISVLYQVGQTTEAQSVLPDEEIDRVANEIQSSPINTVMVVPLGSKIITLPYQSK